LTPSQLHTLQQLLHAGATAYDWPTERWTATRVTTLIFRTFGVEHHPDHVRKVMKKLNF
jgi:putative transposase